MSSLPSRECKSCFRGSLEGCRSVLALCLVKCQPGILWEALPLEGSEDFWKSVNAETVNVRTFVTQRQLADFTFAIAMSSTERPRNSVRQIVPDFTLPGKFVLLENTQT